MANTSPRKQARGRRQLPDVPAVRSQSPRAKAVSFDDDVVETSIGGTQTLTKMKGEPLVPVLDSSNKAGNMDTESDTSSQNQKRTLRNQADIAKSQQPETQTANKENVEKTNEAQNAKTRRAQLTSTTEACETDMFASPIGSPAKSSAHVTDCEKFTLTKIKSDTVRRTQECLDEVPDTFVTPPQHLMRRHTLETKIFETPDCYSAVQMETPRKSSLDFNPGTDDSLTEVEDGDGEDSCSITVAVRVRPYSQRELSDPNVKCVITMNGKETVVKTGSGGVHRFAFDFSFWSFDQDHGEFSNQQCIYTSLAQPLLGKAFEGYNTCLFAYGQTGSGKSYSIMGHGKDIGIIPRFCEELFNRAVKASNRGNIKISVEISFFEIYNEKIHDLLACSKEKSGKKATLKVREHPVLGPYVEGLSTFVVNSFDDVEGWITLGTKNRATAATGMNDKSSRSHSVFTIVMTQTRTERVENQDHDHSITSKINLVDLAGSERQSQAQTTGERLREGANINKSLLTLGKVISLLSERSIASKKRKIFIPYRDSVLTWLLKESLGGNSKTAMIATISPSHHHVEETLSTLRYAHQTRSIVNVVRVNEDPKAKIIRELRAEIDKLRSQSGTMNEDMHLASIAEIAMLREKLMSKEKEMDELSRSWQERLRQAEARKQEESKQLERSGVAAVKVDNQLPNLVNLNEDPQLSELLLYIIKTGQTRVGQKRLNSSHDIQLSGALIADNHCIINNMEGIVNITPIGDAPTYVNGNLITEPTILHHADRVILGGDHYFRFNHPMEVKKNKSGFAVTEIKDFEFAKQELLQVQEAKLQEELEEAQKAAQAKMEEELERARREAEQELDQQRSGYENKLADLEKTLKEQTLEVEKAMQSKQEAHSLIEDLRKQKMMLEQEVLAGRKRQQLEAEAAEKVTSELTSNKSRILELLEAERAKAAMRLNELRQRRAEMITPTKRCRSEGAASVGIRKDLYKVALLLREANKISQYLKKNLVFSREDLVEEGDDTDPEGAHTLIRVTNTRHRIFCRWTVARLEEKVLQMRDLYQNGGDSSADDDEVFYDPEDSWEKESLSTSTSPVVSPVSGVCSQTFMLSPSSSKTFVLSPSSSSPLLKRVPLGLSTSMMKQDTSVYRAYRKMVSSLMDQFNAPLSLEESMADRILWDCHMLKSCVSSVLDTPGNGSSSSDPHQPSCPLQQLFSSLQLLTNHCTIWTATFDRDTPLVRDLLSQLDENVRAAGIHVSHLLQGYEADLTSLIEESSAKLSQELLGVCHTCGQLALATKTRIVRLEQFTQDSSSSQLRPEICQAFLSGCNKLMDRTLQGGIKTLEQRESGFKQLCDSSTLCQELTAVTDEVNQTVVCTKMLLKACQEVQEELDLCLKGRDSIPSLTYRRLQQQSLHVSCLAETAKLLTQCAEHAVKGESQDYRRIHRCAELIKKRAQYLLHYPCSDSLSTSSTFLDNSLSPQTSHSIAPDDTKSQDNKSHKPVPSSTSSQSESVSILSDSQVEHIDFAAQNVLVATQTLMNNVLKWIDQPGYTGSTPVRGKRLLPVSPGMICSPISSLQQASARQNIVRTSSAVDADDCVHQRESS